MRNGQTQTKKRKTNNAGRKAPSVLTPAQREAREKLTQLTVPIPAWVRSIRDSLEEIRNALSAAQSEADYAGDAIDEDCCRVAGQISVLTGTPVPYPSRVAVEALKAVAPED
jgi:hypothetical protein